LDVARSIGPAPETGRAVLGQDRCSARMAGHVPDQLRDFARWRGQFPAD